MLRSHPGRIVARTTRVFVEVRVLRVPLIVVHGDVLYYLVGRILSKETSTVVAEKIFQSLEQKRAASDAGSCCGRAAEKTARPATQESRARLLRWLRVARQWRRPGWLQQRLVPGAPAAEKLALCPCS